MALSRNMKLAMLTYIYNIKQTVKWLICINLWSSCHLNLLNSYHCFRSPCMRRALWFRLCGLIHICRHSLDLCPYSARSTGSSAASSWCRIPVTYVYIWIAVRFRIPAATHTYVSIAEFWSFSTTQRKSSAWNEYSKKSDYTCRFLFIIYVLNYFRAK